MIEKLRGSYGSPEILRITKNRLAVYVLVKRSGEKGEPEINIPVLERGSSILFVVAGSKSDYYLPLPSPRNSFSSSATSALRSMIAVALRCGL
jgi:hypothetical protein